MKTRRCRICKTKFEPMHKTSKVCSCTCAVKYYDTKITKKGKKASREVARMVGMRSMGEVRFYAENIEGKQTFTTKYEPDSYTYTVEETRTYTPDFKIKTKSGKVFYIEYKGVLDLETRKKMVRVRDQHPKLDIRFVFQKAGNKIRKGSKTTYGMWATKNNFKWADNTIPARWLK